MPRMKLDTDRVLSLTAMFVGVGSLVTLAYQAGLTRQSQPRAVKTLFKSDGVWTLDELDRLAPSTVLEGLRNPAPVAVREG